MDCLPMVPQTVRVKLAAGAADVDLFWPETAETAPLVIVAHGFSRRRHNMSGWGQHLAQEGFVAAVPDLPAWSDHARNGRFISDLCAYLCAGESWSQRIDPSRVGLHGVLRRRAGHAAVERPTIRALRSGSGSTRSTRTAWARRRLPWSGAAPSC